MRVKKELDYLVIPDSSEKMRIRKNKRAQKELRKRQIGEIVVLNGRDSEEDVLYLGKIVKKNQRVGIVTFPLHYLEYLEIIRKARRDGKFPQKVIFENIKIRQGIRLWLYGLLGLAEEKLKHRETMYKRNRHERILQKIKELFHRFI